jgi:hypothetical protein
LLRYYEHQKPQGELSAHFQRGGIFRSLSYRGLVGLVWLFGEVSNGIESSSSIFHGLE